MRKLENLNPERVFFYFEEICNIPHGSYNIDRISDYLVSFAKEHDLKYIQDSAKNVIIYKDASKGYEDKEAVIIQGHMDMVAVQTKDSHIDMTNEGLELLHDEDYVWADKTTLGADDGIAVAYALAILESDSLKHPKLEVVITTNEEVGMDGALALDASLLEGKMVLNIDSEEEGILTVGCAGGIKLESSYKVTREQFSGKAYCIKVSGLNGGHSGTMIHLQRANANVIIGRILNEIWAQNDIRIVSLCGGEKGNAIPNSSEVVIVTESNEICDVIEQFSKIIRDEYKANDSGIKIECVKLDKCDSDALTKIDSRKCIDIIIAPPDGVIGYSNEISSLVETSLNMGVMRLSQDELYTLYELRSCKKSKMNELKNKLEIILESIGAVTTISSAYPEWEYKSDSKLLVKMKNVYHSLYGKDPEVNIIHAGLECGILSEKIDGFDGVSFGPDILDIHTPMEKLDIKSTERVWQFVIKILEEL